MAAGMMHGGLPASAQQQMMWDGAGYGHAPPALAAWVDAHAVSAPPPPENENGAEDGHPFHRQVEALEVENLEMAGKMAGMEALLREREQETIEMKQQLLAYEHVLEGERRGEPLSKAELLKQVIALSQQLQELQKAKVGAPPFQVVGSQDPAPAAPAAAPAPAAKAVAPQQMPAQQVPRQAVPAPAPAPAAPKMAPAPVALAPVAPVAGPAPAAEAESETLQEGTAELLEPGEPLEQPGAAEAEAEKQQQQHAQLQAAAAAALAAQPLAPAAAVPGAMQAGTQGYVAPPGARAAPQMMKPAGYQMQLPPAQLAPMPAAAQKFPGAASIPLNIPPQLQHLRLNTPSGRREVEQYGTPRMSQSRSMAALEYGTPRVGSQRIGEDFNVGTPRSAFRTQPQDNPFSMQAPAPGYGARPQAMGVDPYGTPRSSMGMGTTPFSMQRPPSRGGEPRMAPSAYAAPQAQYYPGERPMTSPGPGMMMPQLGPSRSASLAHQQSFQGTNVANMNAAEMYGGDITASGLGAVRGSLLTFSRAKNLQAKEAVLRHLDQMVEHGRVSSDEVVAAVMEKCTAMMRGVAGPPRPSGGLLSNLAGKTKLRQGEDEFLKNPIVAEVGMLVSTVVAFEWAPPNCFLELLEAVPDFLVRRLLTLEFLNGVFGRCGKLAVAKLVGELKYLDTMVSDGTLPSVKELSNCMVLVMVNTKRGMEWRRKWVLGKA